MVNPGAFCGKRKLFLIGEREDYAVAVKEDRAAEQLADIMHQYFKCFPISMPDNVEPTDEELSKINDDVPDPEPGVPDESLLDPSEYQKQLQVAKVEGEELLYKISVSFH